MTLHKAAAASDVKQLKALLNKGTPIDARDRGGRTPLLLAAQTGKLGAIRLLLEAGADPNAESKDGERPLTAAMLYGTPAVVQVLVDHGAEVNFFDQGHDTPLMCAVGYGSPKMLELLLKAGADPSTRRADGRSALDLIDGVIDSGVIGVRATDHQIRKLLIDAGAKPARAANPKSPPRPPRNKLCEAAKKGQVAAISRILRAGAPVDELDAEGRTALWLAASENQAAAVEVLLAAGANPNIDLTRYVSILEAAVGSDSVACVKALLAAGADPNRHQALHTTPLAEKHGAAIARMLIAAGADVHAPGYEGKSVLTHARAWGNKPLVKLLEKHLKEAPAGKPADPLDSFATVAATPAYRQVLERLGTLCRKPPRHFRDRERDFRGDARGVFRLDFDATAVAASFGVDAASWMDKSRADRETMLADLLERLAGEVRDAGFLLVNNHDLSYKSAHSRLLLPTHDKYLVILAHNTNGNGFFTWKRASVFLGPEVIVAWLSEMEVEDPFELTGVARDVVSGRFLRPVKDPRKLAQRMVRFCPDLMDGASVKNAADVAQQLRDDPSFYFWWD